MDPAAGASSLHGHGNIEREKKETREQAQGREITMSLLDLPNNVQELIIKSAGLSANALASTSQYYNQKAQGFVGAARFRRVIVNELLNIAAQLKGADLRRRDRQIAKALENIVLHDPKKTDEFFNSAEEFHKPALLRAIAKAKFGAHFEESRGLIPALWDFKDLHEFFPTFKLMVKYDCDSALESVNRSYLSYSFF